MRHMRIRKFKKIKNGSLKEEGTVYIEVELRTRIRLMEIKIKSDT